MSYTVDVNLLLYATDRASPFHDRAVDFLRKCTSGSDILCLAWPTIMGYLRISTHPSIFDEPLSPDEALGNMERLLRLPQVRVISEEDGFWETYRKATAGLAVRGNLVPDAHLAGLLLQHGVNIIYTNDSDFRKFKFLDPRNPFD